MPIYDRAKKKSNARLPQGPRPRPADAGTGTSCTLIDFEGLADLASIPTIQGVSLPDWLSIVSEYEAGGDGNFSGEPSPVTIAFWLYGNPTSQNVEVPNGASSISFYYSSAYSITVTGYDSGGNQVATATGGANFDSATGVYDIWQPISITAPTGKTITTINITGFANYTGMDNLNVCQSPAIASVEMTQAIQQYQTLDDLKASLAANGEPPVPIISNKPAVLRTYFNPVQDVTGVTVNLSGVDTQTKSLSVQPGCTVQKQRAQLDGCQSLDFYFTPPSGSWTAQLDVVDGSGNVLEEEKLPVTSRDTNTLRLSGVSVCDAKDGSGNWLCSDASDLLARTSLIEKIAPAPSVNADVSGSVVRKDIAATAAVGTEAAANVWWDSVTNQVASLWGFTDAIGDALSGRRTTYFGMVRPAPASPAVDPLGGQGGQAQNIPSYGAAGRTSALRFANNTETTVGVVAHETGHTLGLKHTNTDNPSTPAAPPGCYNFASDSSTDWSYPTGTPGSESNTNGIQSTAGPEVGYDVALQAIVNPSTTYEVMSYCSPRWISPQRYKTMIATLGGGPVASPSVREASPATLPMVTPSSTVMPFWQVKGSIDGSTAKFLPLFQVDVKGDTSTGTGTYSLVVEDAKGNALFTRHFTPSTSTTETTGKDSTSKPGFSQLLPVTSGAAAIVLKDTGGIELGRITLSGKAPVVTVITPAAGFVGTGLQTVSWTVQGASTFTTKVLYSSNGGSTWIEIGEVADAASLSVDFSKLAGSTTALIQFLVSDGANTGTATTVPFTVPKKSPHAIYITSPTANYSQAAADPIVLTGTAYDADDGVLTGSALQWTSSIQGTLGSGSHLSVKLKPGTHTITLTATDSDGNAVTAKTTVLIGGAPPVVSLTVQPLNTVPTTCESATVGATPGANGGAGLATVQYSVDGGATYTTIPLNKLPYAFIVPGSGFVHVVARAYDLSRQSNAQDASFLVQSACQGESQSITFGTIANKVYGTAPFTLKATASSGLPVSYTVAGPATLSGSQLTITGVGLVTVTASQPGNSNFAPAAPVAQSFTVMQASLKATADNKTRAFGAANPKLTYTLSGFVNGEGKSVVTGTATLATTATATSGAGTYPITFATEGLAAANYTFVYVPGTLTVTGGPQTQTITFGALANQVYGAAPIVLTATASSGLPVSYTTTGPATLSGNSLTITGAGLISVTASQAGNSSFSAAAPVTRSFNVAKATLTATANSISKSFGSAVPTLTYAVTGFVNQDTAAVVSGIATLTTTATATSPVGMYPITFSTEALIAANYSFVYVSGVLTVTSTGTACTVIDYSKGFTGSGMAVNGSAKIAGGLLQLTAEKQGQRGSAFYSTRVPTTSFTTDFTFQLNNAQADGFTFVIQGGSAKALGIGGQGLGYAGMPNSVALKFDLHNNAGEGADSTGSYINGANPTVPSISLAGSGIDLHSVHVFALHLVYDGTDTSISLTDTVTKAVVTAKSMGNVAAILGSDTAYFGFTGATGRLTAAQNILTWSYSGGSGCAAK